MNGKPQSNQSSPTVRATTQARDEVKQSVEVQILGQRLVLKSADDPHHLERLVSYVKRKVDEIAAGGPVSSSKIAILAALNIADDYFRVLDEARSFKREVANRSRGLLNELDEGRDR